MQTGNVLDLVMNTNFVNMDLAICHELRHALPSCAIQAFESNTTYLLFKTDIQFLSKYQIEKRMAIIKNFLFYPKKTVEAIIQQEITETKQPFIEFNNILFFLEEAFCQKLNVWVSAGFWIEIENFMSLPSLYFGFDIISLHTFLQRQYDIKYSEAIDEIYAFFETRNFLHRTRHDAQKEGYVQEKNPISINSNIFFDLFFLHFEIIQKSSILNPYNRIIGIVFELKTIHDEIVETYYTFWRHQNSVFYKMFPLPPQPSYDVYSLVPSPYDKKNTDDGSICHLYNSYIDFQDASSPEQSNAYKAFIYGGFRNLPSTNLSSLKGKELYIHIDNRFTYTEAQTIREQVKENKIEKCFIVHNNSELPLEDVLNTPEILNITKPTVEKLLATPEDELIGSNRKREMILDPIIESGTITWLFAQEKTGKTILALFLAQMIGTGDKSFGSWSVATPKKVLYIDGEMPADKINEHINKIIRGYGENPENHKRAFSLFSFYETDFRYEDILDNTWQEEYLAQLLEHDLIILDNYYSLYNLLNPMKLLQWMKKLTKKGVAFLVLDHTNSEGELQGSIVKKRAMDLGIQLERVNSSQIDISLKYDRYGRESHADSFYVIPCFTSSTFSLNTHINSKDKDLELTDKELLVIYALKKKGERNTKVAKKLKTSDSNITKKLKKIDFNAQLQKPKPKGDQEVLAKQKQIIDLYNNNQEKLDDIIPQFIEELQINKQVK